MMTIGYTEYCEWVNSLPSKVKAPKYVVWTPSNMTQDEALLKLPSVCHRLLTFKPCPHMVRLLVQLHQSSSMDGDHAEAELIKSCIITANCMQVRAAEGCTTQELEV